MFEIKDSLDITGRVTGFRQLRAERLRPQTWEAFLPLHVFSQCFDEADCSKLIAVVNAICELHGEGPASPEYREAAAKLVLHFVERYGVNDPDILIKETLDAIARANTVSPLRRSLSGAPGRT